MYSYGSPHMAAQKQGDQLERTFSSYVRIQGVFLKTYLRRWTIGRSGERGSGISVLPARYDDDDLCSHYNVSTNTAPTLLSYKLDWILLYLLRPFSVDLLTNPFIIGHFLCFTVIFTKSLWDLYEIEDYNLLFLLWNITVTCKISLLDSTYYYVFLREICHYFIPLWLVDRWERYITPFYTIVTIWLLGEIYTLLILT